MKYLDLIFFSVIFLASFFARTAMADVSGAAVTWSAKANPGLININAEGGTASGSWAIKNGMGSGKFDCVLADFKTGIDLRDEHMKDKYLETKKFPKATLVVDPVKISENFEWSGKLTLKGVTKPVKGTASISGGELKAEFIVNIEDFPSLKVPSYLGVTMAKTVTVNVSGKI